MLLLGQARSRLVTVCDPCRGAHGTVYPSRGGLFAHAAAEILRTFFVAGNPAGVPAPGGLPHAPLDILSSLGGYGNLCTYFLWTVLSFTTNQEVQQSGCPVLSTAGSQSPSTRQRNHEPCVGHPCGRHVSQCLTIQALYSSLCGSVARALAMRARCAIATVIK